jgi:hypothetical protein
MPSSRRTSQIFPMNPPPLPLGSSGGVPPAASPGHLPFPPLSPAVSGGMAAHEPVRHPRPMTAAELHLELEKEQEAVVSLVLVDQEWLRSQNEATPWTALPGMHVTYQVYRSTD